MCDYAEYKIVYQIHDTEDYFYTPTEETLHHSVELLEKHVPVKSYQVYFYEARLTQAYFDWTGFTKWS